MKLQVGVKVFLKNKEGRFLLLQRNLDKYKNVKGSWDIVGGRIDIGVPLIDNLKREVYEEVQLSFSAERLICAQDILLKEDKHVVRLTYVASVDNENSLVLDTSENIKYAWLTLEEISKQEDLDIYVKEIIDKNFFKRKNT